MLFTGKLITAGFWLAWLVNFVHPLAHPVNWLVGGLGAFLLLMHGFELLIFRSLPAVKGHFRPGDTWKILVFGAFQLWELKRRMEQAPAERRRRR